MPKYEVRVNTVIYGTAYYTVCADDEEEAERKYKAGEADYQETEYGDSEETDVDEVVELDCDGCTDCDDEEDEDEEEQVCGDCVYDKDGKCTHEEYREYWVYPCSNCCYYTAPPPKDELDLLLEQCTPEEPVVEETKARTCADCVHHTGKGTEDAMCKENLHMIRGTYGAECEWFKTA